MRTFFLVMIVFVMLFSVLACAGQGIAPLEGEVYALQLGSTIWGIRQAIAERSGTFIMMKDQLYIFGWAIKDGWAFVCLDVGKQQSVKDLSQIVGGQVVNVKTISALVDLLKTSGWAKIGPEALPPVLLQAAAAKTSWITALAKSLTTFLLVPVPLDALKLEEYIGWNPDGVKG